MASQSDWPPPCPSCGGKQSGWTNLFCVADCKNKKAIPTPIEVEKTQPYPCPHTNKYGAMGSMWCLACGRRC